MMSSIASPSKSRQKFVQVLILLAMLAGCSTNPPVSTPTLNPETAWNQRQHELVAIKQWRLQGRMLVNHGEAAWNLSLDWQQKDGDYQISIHGPFGSGRVKLIGNAKGVILHNGDEQSHYAEHPEELLYQQTGVMMPVEGLRYWMVGLTSPQQATKPKLDELGRLAYLEESKWEVNFKRYTKVSGMDLPRKVFIVKPDQEIDVRLVVDKWTLGAF